MEEDGDPHSSRFVLNSGSFFLDIAKTEHGKISEADLACAAASAMQCWREGEMPVFNSDGSFDLNNNRLSDEDSIILDDSTLFGENDFNETMLRAAIWRSLDRTEILPRPKESMESLIAFLRTRFSVEGQDGGDGICSLEICLAFAPYIHSAIDVASLSDVGKKLVELIRSGKS